MWHIYRDGGNREINQESPNPTGFLPSSSSICDHNLGVLRRPLSLLVHGRHLHIWLGCYLSWPWLQIWTRPWLHSKVCPGHGSAVSNLHANLSELVVANHDGEVDVEDGGYRALSGGWRQVNMVQLGSGQRDGGCDGDRDRKFDPYHATPDLRISACGQSLAAGTTNMDAKVGLDMRIDRRSTTRSKSAAQQLCARVLSCPLLPTTSSQALPQTPVATVVALAQGW